MATGRGGMVAAGLVALVAAGCGGVDRRFVVESNVPNAQVTIDQNRVGPAPAHSPFEFYGKYTITVAHPDYQTKTECVEVRAPWYAYPPFDLLTEVFWPFPVEDVRRLYVPLEPARRPDVGEIMTAAEALRERGHALPPPKDPARPKPPEGPPPGAGLPPGPALPPGGPPPGRNPVPVPTNTPEGTQPRPPAASPLLPSVLPP